MLTKDDFIHHILGEGPRTEARVANDTGHIDGFDFADDAPGSETAETTLFVTPLLQAGFGDGQGIPRATVIRSTDAVARYIPDEVRYWPKTSSRPHHTLLIEADLTHRELLAIPAFKSRQLAHLDIAEDALARLVAEVLEGFQRGAEGLDASALKGQKCETLCVVSIIDEREDHAVRLACFGTFNAKTEGLETFFLTQHRHTWDRGDAAERLGLVYERQFKKLGEAFWQEAFTTTDERKQADKLLKVCTRNNVAEKDMQESILDLLDTIARGFGLRKKADAARRLRAFPLPGEHDIGMDSEERDNKYDGINPFSGITLRDDHSRLLGYIVYPLKTKSAAEKLRQHLEKHNRFHNVLVVYPDANQASIELWQGREQLTGKLRSGQIHKDAADVVNLLSRFFVVSKAKVRNPSELAQELAYRARYLRRLALRQIEDEPKNGQLRRLYTEFTKALVHDLSEAEFADAFAQTLTYSLLTARWVLSAQDATTTDRFSRKEAMKRLSIGSRFLAEMLNAVLSMSLDDRARLLWLVDDVADLLDRVDIVSVFRPDGTDLTSDPIVHFYEPFLAAYDAKIRVQRGAFYTPQPVVSYIVRSVHELLQTEFDLADGLADTTTWGEMVKRNPSLKLPPLTDEPGEKRTISPDEPFVQVLDPATGTATFLVEVIDVIHRTLGAKWKRQRLTESQQRAAWNDYVPRHLLPRLHAFELMMAPYAIAHMKIGLKLADSGYGFGAEECARIYLTNALEPGAKELPPIGFDALAHEAVAVNAIKRHKRFTVVIGNPPYANYGQLNKIPFILNLLGDYKRGLAEKKLNLDDDFIKFIRFSQHLLDTTDAGVFGMITNNSFVDGITHRQMRQSLLGSFSLVHVQNLHGSSKKKETAPDRAEDENVFDIQQGVATTLAVASSKHQTAKVFTSDLWGKRATKYAELSTTSVRSTKWSVPKVATPHFFFTERNLDDGAEYNSFWGLKAIFISSGNGVKTERDGVSIHFTKEDIETSVRDFQTLDEPALRRKYKTGDDSRDWTIKKAKADTIENKGRALYRRLLYRPFDIRHTWYSGQTRGFIGTPAFPTMQHMQKGNVALVTTRQTAERFDLLCTDNLVGHKSVAGYDINTAFPLYTFERTSTFDLGEREAASSRSAPKHPNLSASFLKSCAAALGLPQKGAHGLPVGLTPEDIFHYAYAVFHSPGYRNRYAEFLRIDFPRLPLPLNLDLFRALAQVGGELTALHLLESPKLARPLTEFVGNSRQVGRVAWCHETVWLDAPARRKLAPQAAGRSGFRGVPEAVWNFRIGGYQVCDKWLKDRKGRELSQNDIDHYHKTVGAISETIRIMAGIDELIDENGGWPGAFIAKATAA